MDWLTITPTQIELDLDVITPLALLQSLMDKIEQAPTEAVKVDFVGEGQIFRLDGNTYNYAEYRLTIREFSSISSTPLIIGDIV